MIHLPFQNSNITVYWSANFRCNSWEHKNINYKEKLENKRYFPPFRHFVYLSRDVHDIS